MENNATPVDSGNKTTNILVYIGILFIVGLVSDHKNDPDVKFHTNQGIVLTIFGTIVSCITCGIGSIAYIVFMIIGIMNANKGEMKPLPLIGKIQILK